MRDGGQPSGEADEHVQQHDDQYKAVHDAAIAAQHELGQGMAFRHQGTDALPQGNHDQAGYQRPQCIAGNGTYTAPGGSLGRAKQDPGAQGSEHRQPQHTGALAVARHQKVIQLVLDTTCINQAGNGKQCGKCGEPENGG